MQALATGTNDPAFVEHLEPLGSSFRSRAVFDFRQPRASPGPDLLRS
jgi:hypothetical protein